jgi:hypothetical protein
MLQHVLHKAAHQEGQSLGGGGMVQKALQKYLLAEILTKVTFIHLFLHLK